ncbi:MAG: tyrosine-type recombinase/integrase [Polyangia bacterium]|nr:tyrosine-type recombinase/integrase [Polyangia bacterium]
MTELARDGGLIDWSLHVRGLPSRAYRDTRGPSRDQVAAILRAADADRNPTRAARDGALLRLLYGLALRRSEVVGLDVCHLDLEGARIAILGKGKHDRELMTLPLPVVAALTRWLDNHPEPGPESPLFVALDRASRGHRLSDRSVDRLVKAHCRTAEVRACSPHALRHAAITHALDATSGDVRRVRAFSRHARLETLTLYDDNRLDGAGAVAALVAM